MSLEKHFNEVKPREVSGSLSSDRFQYQKDWALCQLLKLHAEGVDYLMAFDIHDDVVVFQPEQSPNKICFYQVKTKKTGSAWQKGEFTSRKKGKDKNLLPSIVGKMYGSVLLFSDYAHCTTFLSNSPFKLALSPDGKQATLLANARTPFDKLPKQNQQAILDTIKKEHSLKVAPVLDKLMWFEVSELSLEGHSTYAVGKLAEFLDARKPGKYNTPVAYKTLSDELRRRNDYSQENLTFSQMAKLKAIGKSEFENILAAAVPDDTAERTWPEVASSLQQEGFGLRDRIQLKRAWFRADVYRSDSSNSAFWMVLDLAKLIAPRFTSLKQLLEDGLTELKGKIPGNNQFDDDLLSAFLLIQVFCE
jgi:hypothetical protein